MRKQRGFTLIELMIVIAVIAIIATIAIPNLLAAKLVSNESAAVANMRTILNLQIQMRTQISIDQDLDGLGEFGWFGELAGAVGLRDFSGAAGPITLSPPMLPTYFRVDANGVVNRAGYLFAMFLPAAGAVPLGENANGGTPTGENPDQCENAFVCYAWPAGRNVSGNRAFVVNQVGDILHTTMTATQYDGTAAIPAGNAAFTGATLLAPISIGGIPGPALDGNNWVAVN